MSAWTDFRDGALGLLKSDGVLSSAAALAANQVGKGSLEDISSGFQTQSQALRDDLSSNMQFNPYTVTTGAGTMGFDRSGLTLNPANQGVSEALNAQALQQSYNLGGTTPAGLANITGAGSYGTQQAMQQSQMLDTQLAGQRGGMNQLFNQQLGQVGEPAQAIQGVTGTALTGAEGLLGGAVVPQNVQALQAQYGDLASQAAAGLGQGTSQQEIFDQLQGMTAGDRERQALQLENRLAAQGRLGVNTAAYGGTPEQLAMAKAQEEARSANALQAMQMSDALQSSQQARALGLADQSSSLSQLGSALRGQDIAQGSQLASLGLQGTSTGQALTSQQLQNLGALQGQDIQSAQAQEALQQANITQAQGLFGLSSGAAALPSQLQGQDIQNLTGMLNASGIPQQQLLNASQTALGAQQLGSSYDQSLFNALASLGGQELTSLTDFGLASSTLDQELIRQLGNIASAGGS